MRVCIAVYLKPIYKVEKMYSDIYRLKRTYLQLRFLQDLAFGRQSCLQWVKSWVFIYIYIYGLKAECIYIYIGRILKD